MAKTNYTALSEQLKSVSNPSSDSGNRRGYRQAYSFIAASGLSEGEKKVLMKALHTAADTNHGYHYNSNGVHGALKAIAELDAANEDSFDPEPPVTLLAEQLAAKVKDGRIFEVGFIQRTTGVLRTVSYRLGVKKALHRGKLSCSPAGNELPNVSSMNDQGSRMIPLDYI